MASFLQDVTGDLALTTGRLSLVTGSVQKGQKLRNLFQLVRGAWFLDTRVGVPYFEKIFRKVPSLNPVKQLFRKVILSVEGIASVPSITATLDPKTRALTCNFIAVDDTGTQISGTSAPFVDTV